MLPNEKSPRTIRIQTALLLLVMFVAGVVTGAAVVRLSSGHRPPPRHGDGGIPRPLLELGLSQAQQTQVRAIMDKHRAEFEAVFRETRPKVQAVQEQVDQEIRPLLTPEQQQRLEELNARRSPHHDDGPMPYSKEPPPPDGPR